MKAKIFSLMALVLCLVSCQTEPEGFDVIVGGEVDTTITVAIPEAETRSSANSAVGIFNQNGECTEGTMRYILQVYHKGETNAQNRQVKYSTGTSVSFPVRLVPGRDYQFVVWADVVDAADTDSKYYDTSDLKNITLKDNSWNAMDEKRDAFTATYMASMFNGSQSINIPLYRPFAKLRIVATDYDVLAQQPSGAVVPHHATVKYYTDHRVAFNAYTGKAADATLVEKEHNEYVIKTYSNENDINGDHTIFSDYFFAENDIVRFEISVYTEGGELIKKTTFPTDINVRRNYLTTLKGDVLTEGGNVGVTVLPGIGGADEPDYNYTVVTSAKQLIDIANAGGQYKIGADLVVDPSLIAQTSAITRTNSANEPKVTTIDLNGYTVTVKNTSDKAVITVAEGNTLIFANSGNDNGKIVLAEGSTESFIDNKGNVVLTSGEIKNESTDVPVIDGTIVVNEDAELNDDKVVEANIITVSEENDGWLANVLENGGTYVFTEDMTSEVNIEVTATAPVILDGNGKTITFTANANRGFRITNANTVTFEDVTIVNNADTGRCIDTRTGNINLTLENVTLTATNGNSQPFTVGGSGDNLNVNINNSTINAGINGYGIITFNPASLNINASTITGYAALYIKPASNSLGSAGSEINIVNSTLNGVNNVPAHESNSFSTIAIADNNIEINVDSTSTVKATTSNGNGQSIVGFGSSLVESAISGCKLTFAGNIVLEGDHTSFVGCSSYQGGLGGNEVKFAAKYADELEAEGWIVSEPAGDLVTISSVIAQVGDNVYKTLAEAVAAVEDGGTITLVDNEVFTENNRYNNGGWWDGLGYAGDKDFTIDLNGYTISQDGALNDYLLWFKNVGSKANTITIKNGTLDAGTTAFCALCTASSHENELTINLENITLTNNHSNGSTIKVRAGSTLNVNAGTKIIGQNSYLGIENWNATVNVYEGAEIYMNGTTSYNGCLIGVGGNGVVNVYGGYGKGVSGGLIAMTSGGTINVSGGEWIANTDGAYANSNKSVLIAQSDKQYNAGAGNAIVNVTGGTFKGGYNCYGNAVGDAQINIKGGNFNCDPSTYVVSGYETVVEQGIFTVGKPQALVAFEEAMANGGEVKLTADITLLETVVLENVNVVLDLNGKTVTAPLFSAFEVKSGAELTIKNGKVVAYESTVRAIGGKATIESGEYTSTGTALDSPATYRYSLDCREGGKLIINGGTFKSNNGMINVSSAVTINGGKFENIVEKSMTRHFAYVSALLTINDGEFYGKANSSAGGCFFCGAAAGCNIQVNGGKFTSLWTSGSVNRIFEVYFGGTINVTGGMFNTNGGIVTFVTENTDEATKAAYPYVAK